jgi:hypothetical protein
MFLILTAAAAIVTTIIWYVKAPDDKYRLGTLSFIYWGATMMWLVDHVIAYLTKGGAFFEMTLDATLLGVTVILVGLIAWLLILLIKDPKGVFPKLLRAK